MKGDMVGIEEEKRRYKGREGGEGWNRKGALEGEGEEEEGIQAGGGERVIRSDIRHETD